ncbi:hypothetical protein [Paenibacillus sp. WLX2291]|uniref:hypothetical protein n=1 Tax=Paenibacillus sp. WLX2291 TaxID=3296934 RepID=UPI003983F094
MRTSFTRFMCCLLSAIVLFTLAVPHSKAASNATTLDAQHFKLLHTYTAGGKETTQYELNQSDQNTVYTVTEDSYNIVVQTTRNNEEIDKTVIDKNSKKIDYMQNNQTIQQYDLDDHVKVLPTDTSQLDEDTSAPTISSENQALSASSMPLLKSAYNSGVGQYGYLYGTFNTTYGDTYQVKFSVGTAVSVIVGALVGVATGTGLVLSIISALGSTVIADAIVNTIYGTVFAQSKHYDLEVRSQGEVGLVSKQTIVNAKVNNYQTGKSSWVYLRTEGDGRNWEDMCTIGAYNVYISKL